MDSRNYKFETMIKKKYLLTAILMLGLIIPAGAQDPDLGTKEKPQLKIGGALRFNYNYSDWKPGNRKRWGDFGFDVFRLNVDASYRGFKLAADYRFYPASSGGGMLKHGWIGYQFKENHQLQIGLVTVPFGILPYSSNSYFFNLQYYVGLEDDADMGVEYIFRNRQWDVRAAFFKNSGLTDFGEKSELTADRYSYDIAGGHKEVNQGNVYATYRWGDKCSHQVGTSVLVGGVYNIGTRSVGYRWAASLHYVLDYRRWNFKAQFSTYNIHLSGAPMNTRHQVTMAAFGSTYQVASKADIYSAALVYRIPVRKKFLDEVCIYNDFSYLYKHVKGAFDSFQNVTGCSLVMGPLFVYIDYAIGRNHAWIGNNWDNAFAQGSDNATNIRFNINMGYYF